LTEFDAAAGVGQASVFRPVVSLAEETTVGFEAVTRWSGLTVDTQDFAVTVWR
jgi:sensor c-di-GMP phosphodiesterase-like protein